MKKVFCKTTCETMENPFENSKNPHLFQSVQTLPNASECIRMRPGRSEWIQMGPNTSEKLVKALKKLAKTSKNFVNLFTSNFLFKTVFDIFSKSTRMYRNTQKHFRVSPTTSKNVRGGRTSKKNKRTNERTNKRSTNKRTNERNRRRHMDSSQPSMMAEISLHSQRTASHHA